MSDHHVYLFNLQDSQLLVKLDISSTLARADGPRGAQIIAQALRSRGRERPITLLLNNVHGVAQVDEFVVVLTCKIFKCSQIFSFVQIFPVLLSLSR